MDWQTKLSELRSSLPDADIASEEQPASEVEETPAVNTSRVDIILEKKGRAGKTATIITGFNCAPAMLQDIAAKLKRSLATGGSTRGNEILVQGDRRAAVQSALNGMGIKSRII